MKLAINNIFFDSETATDEQKKLLEKYDNDLYKELYPVVAKTKTVIESTPEV